MTTTHSNWCLSNQAGEISKWHLDRWDQFETVKLGNCKQLAYRGVVPKSRTTLVLDPCPWCKGQPKIETLSPIVTRGRYSDDDVEVVSSTQVEVTCCNVSITCERDKVVEQWNWMYK